LQGCSGGEMQDSIIPPSRRGDIKRAARRGVTPLRYPGGKRKLAPVLAGMIDRAGLDVDLFVEPFAGGAAVSISLLEAGYVRRIGLADLDPLVSSFWKIVFSPHARELADRVLGADVTLDEWRRLKGMEPATVMDAAFKCFFLNRTSFSGNLTKRAGPMGGLKQTGEYLIDYRFHAQSREKLARRILQLSGLADRVAFVGNESYADTMERVPALAPRERTLWYLDPPYFEKADVLYRHVFGPEDHEALRRNVDHMPGHWILSYDDHPDARRLYGDHPGFSLVDLRYSVRRNGRPMASEVLVSDLGPWPVSKAPEIDEAASSKSRVLESV